MIVYKILHLITPWPCFKTRNTQSKLDTCDVTSVWLICSNFIIFWLDISVQGDGESFGNLSNDSKYQELWVLRWE